MTGLVLRFHVKYDAGHGRNDPLRVLLYKQCSLRGFVWQITIR